MAKPTIGEVVVVEGKTDTAKLKRLFDVNTIETNGSALNPEIINLIKLASQANGVILFLDPDHQGNKIRSILRTNLINFKEAFINKSDCCSKKKVGIAEASDEAIIKALSQVVELSKNQSSLLWSDYLTFNLNSKKKRNQVCSHFKIPYFNNKQLFNMLNALGITKEQLKEVISE